MTQLILINFNFVIQSNNFRCYFNIQSM